jgi:CDP-diacylglycerol--serine O-phosphatidyltransferase
VTPVDVRSNLRRGVYVIPTSFTVLNVFFGFRCIVNCMLAMTDIADGRFSASAAHFERACMALVIAAIMDTFDGLVARALGATSEFVKEYDSLADVVTFGAAPAVLIYAWSLRTLDNLGAGIAFLFLVAVSLRLARFNVMTGKTDYRYFVGLPSPAGALTLAAVVYYAPAPVFDRPFSIVIMILTTAVAFAMVSPIRWRSQKGLKIQRERSAFYVLVLTAILAVAISWPKPFLFAGAICYFISGPLLRLWSIAFPPRQHDDPPLTPIEVP